MEPGRSFKSPSSPELVVGKQETIWLLLKYPLYTHNPRVAGHRANRQCSKSSAINPMGPTPSHRADSQSNTQAGIAAHPIPEYFTGKSCKLNILQVIGGA